MPSRAMARTRGWPAFETIHVLWVIGFLAGFSERFAWDFVDRAQGRAAGDQPPPRPKG
jgi:hypothetical protein